MRLSGLTSSTIALALTLASLGSVQADPERYLIDSAGAHAFIQFRVKHLAYSWLYGRFDRFGGSFTYDPDDPSRSSVSVTIETKSIDTNHAERDQHLRGHDFLDVDRYPTASFASTSYTETGFGTAVLEGQLTLKGVTRPIRIQLERIGNGPDPWGGYRRGFQGEAELTLRDFGIDYNLGPAAHKAELILSIEGIRQ